VLYAVTTAALSCVLIALTADPPELGGGTGGGGLLGGVGVTGEVGLRQALKSNTKTKPIAGERIGHRSALTRHSLCISELQKNS
jgi:hypothetical protein